MRRRWLRTALFLAAGALLILAVAAAWRTSIVGPARALRSDIAARSTARFPRPPQVEPATPGTFGQHAAMPWETLARLQAGSADVELCRAVRAGEQPFEALTPSCVRELQSGAPALDALLEATHAAEAGPPPGLGTLDAPAPALGGWSTLPYAARLGALRIRQLLAAGDAAGAARSCVDLQALARDASWGTGLSGRLPALGAEEATFRSCVAALDVLPPGSKPAVGEALRRVEKGTPDFAAVIAEYGLGARAQAFAAYLGPLDGLPPQVGQWARQDAPERPTGWLFALALGDAWHRIDARLAAAVDAARAPMPGRADRLDRLSAGERPVLNPAAGFALPQLGRVARSDARGRAQLRLLRAAVAADLLRDRQGRWPTASELSRELGPSEARATLGVEPQGEAALLVDPDVPRGELAVTIQPDR